MKYYSVFKGRTPGVYMTWDECKNMVYGFKGAKYKRFDNLEEATKFSKNGLLNTSNSNTIDTYFCKKNVDKTIHKIYTDGSCYGNGNKISLGGYGIYIDHENYYVEPLYCVTNNVAELMAILRVFAIMHEEIKKGDLIEIITDSDYSIKAFTTYGQKCNDSFWKKDIPNKELIKKGFRIVKKYPNIKFTHIHSHTGKKDINSINNEKVDKLAKQGLLLAIKNFSKLGEFKFKIGKYKNNTIDYVFKNDRQYIKWFTNNNISNKDIMFQNILKEYILKN